MALGELKIIYRSNSHAPFWVVAEKSGVWEKNDIAVNTSPQPTREKAVEALRNGHVDLISGNHHNLRRVRIMFTWLKQLTIGRKTAWWRLMAFVQLPISRTRK